MSLNWKHVLLLILIPIAADAQKRPDVAGPNESEKSGANVASTDCTGSRGFSKCQWSDIMNARTDFGKKVKEACDVFRPALATDPKKWQSQLDGIPAETFLKAATICDGHMNATTAPYAVLTNRNNPNNHIFEEIKQKKEAKYCEANRATEFCKLGQSGGP